MYYICVGDDHTVVKADLYTWGHWFENNENRIVGKDYIGDDVLVSTVCIGFDHRHFGNGPPLILETMIFGGPLDREMWRYSTWDDAEIGHKMACKKARAMAERLRNQLT
jgi:hypothetical protein